MTMLERNSTKIGECGMTDAFPDEPQFLRGSGCAGAGYLVDFRERRGQAPAEYGENGMKSNTRLAAFAVAFAAAAAVTADAKPTAGTPFADNMVLQRGMAVPVWGTAEPGETVKVAFAGQTKSAVAGRDGAWKVALDPMEASKEPRTLEISGKDGGEKIANVLVGEVWFACGQSNTECPIWGANPRYRDGQGAVMTAMARRPFIRYAKNSRNVSLVPRLGWKAAWHDFSPESFKATFPNNLSAIAFYYALELYSALEIPVGIVDSSWGGTRIEPWTPACAFKTPPVMPKAAKPQTPTALWNGMVAAWTPFAMRGFIWYQGCSNIGNGAAYCGMMHALYAGWSREFANPNLKLYFVQLAPFSRSWFEVQKAQAKFAEEEKNAAIVTTCDVGNSWDIHPNDKETVARRLALHALKRDYGFDWLIDDPPAPKAWKVEGDKVSLEFKGAKSFYFYNADRSQPKGFEIAGPDGAFKPAKILNKIASGGTYAGSALELKADGVAEPKRLRYLATKPWIGSLYSFDSGLPAGPFEIDLAK